MADHDTSRLRALLEKAEALPWSSSPEPLGRVVRFKRTYWGIGHGEPHRNGKGVAFAFGSDSSNADLIVAAVNALPALLTAAERAKGLEEENARLRAALRGLLDTGWHRDYGYGDPACDVPYGGECSCGLTNAKNAARAALEAGK